MAVKVIKKLFSIVLVLCVVVALFPLPVNASEIVDSGEWGQEGSDVKWTLDSDGVMTVFGTGKMWDCYIYGSDSHGDYWFRVWDEYMQDITEVVICEGITYIGEDSFSGAGNLKSVTIADSVEEIGRSAFANCDSLTDISFGNGLVRADICVFYDCDALTSFTFPQTETTYGSSFLSDCDNLKNITLSDKMGVLTYSMFGGCTSLESITIPAGITEIGGYAFGECIALQHVEIPETVTAIHDQAFAFCNAMETITLPDSLLEMGNRVFENCASLKEVTVPVNVGQMAHTFENAYGLESVKFIGNAPVCGGNLFGNITITAYYPDNNKTWTETVRQNYGGTVTWKPYKSDIIPNNTIASGICGERVSWKLTDTFTLIISGTGDMYDYIYDAPWTDYCSRIEAVIIEPGVTSVGNYSFIECRALQNAEIANTVKHIGNSGFHNCVQLLELTIPEGTVTIGEGAFSGCINMEKIQFLGDAPSIGYYAFREMTTIAYYPGSYRAWKNVVNQDYGGLVTWVPVGHVHEDTMVVTPPSCTEEGYTTYICACGDSYVADYVDATGHAYEEGVCGNCGAADPDYQPVEEQFDIDSANMTLGNNLAMNFYVDPDYIDADEDYYAEITKTYADGRDDVVVLIDDENWKVDSSDGFYYFTLNQVAAKEMADAVYVVIYRDEAKDVAVSEVWEDSVRAYAERALKKEEGKSAPDADKLALYVDLLNYGAEAQIYFDYNVDDLANKNLTAEQLAYGQDEVTMTNDSVRGTGYAGMDLVLKSEIILDFYFTNIPDDHAGMYAIATYENHYGEEKQIRVEGEAFLQDPSDGCWYVPVKGLVVADCMQDVTIQIYAADGTVIGSAVDSVESYIARISNASPLYEAIMKFAVSAYNSFH